MNKDVCLINMPYSSLERPSLALGLIEGYVAKYGHTAKVMYGTLEFAKVIGVQNYYLVDNTNHEDMMGEWTFSRVAFPDKVQNDEAYFNLFPHLHEAVRNKVMKVRELAGDYIAMMADKVLALNPKVVGCTSTFQQNCASLALLRQIKERAPHVITMMGGANCEGHMGQSISNNFTWVDYVFSGECDQVIGGFIDELIVTKTKPVTLPKGIITPNNNNNKPGTVPEPGRAVVNDMAIVGSPNYDSYFNALRELDLVEEIEPGLIVETSRGCWWGAKQHCVFCGLNGGGMEHRSKLPERVLEEWNEMSEKYGINNFEVVDNILPVEYFSSLLPQLSEKEEKFSVFYETKSNLRDEQVKQLADAGVKWIQPGFESLHDDFLKLIKKGVKAVQNVAALKWCREHGVRLSWNILSNAPGEEDEWFHEMASWLPLIAHYQPPQQYMIKIRYQRFSPYFDRADEYGLTLSALRSYGFIYPLKGQDLFDIAYFFEGESKDKATDYTIESANKFTKPGHAALQEKIIDWYNSFWRSGTPQLMCMIDFDDYIRILDTRKVATQISVELKGLAARIYRICYKPVSKSQVMRMLAETKAEDEAEVEAVLQDFVDRNLALFLSGRYMSLALKGEVPVLPTHLEYPGGFLSFLRPKAQAKTIVNSFSF